MAASVTLTEKTFGVIKKITWEWTAHTDGVVAKATPNAQTTVPYNGEIVRLVTVPGTGDDAPDLNYDVSVYDGDDMDVLNTAGQNRHNVNAEQVISALGVIAYSKLTLYVSGAGASNKGTVHLYVR